MDSKLVFLLALVGLMAFSAADTDCTRINPATGKGDYNCTVIRLPPEKPPGYYIQPSDISVGIRDIFAKTRLNISSIDKRLVISLTPACEADDLVLQVTYDRQPVPNATVALYSQGGGRKLVSEVTTDTDGWALFSPKKAGRYDLVATKYVYEQEAYTNRTNASQAYPLGQLILTVDLCDQAASWPAQTNYSASNEAPESSISYAQGFARRYRNITLPDGKKAVRMEVRYAPSGDFENVTLVDFVPAGLASNSSAVGFEQDYPQSIRQADGTLAIEWQLDGVENSSGVIRSYVILRPPEAMDARAFGSPVLLDANQSVLAGQNPAAASLAPPPKKAEGWNLDLDQLAIWIAGLAALVLLIAAAGHMWNWLNSEKTKK